MKTYHVATWGIISKDWDRILCHLHMDAQMFFRIHFDEPIFSVNLIDPDEYVFRLYFSRAVMFSDS
jgi:hypothetical protein